MITFEPLTMALGAEVSGIDLRQPLDAASAKALRAGLLDYQVLFFRNQAIDPSHHLALAHLFGEASPHPAYPTVPGYPSVNILESTAEKPTKIDSWHTDMTFLPCPPLGSILHAKQVPACGGDTLFASLFAAYDSLSQRMKDYLEGLTAMHSFAHGFRHSLAEPGGWERLGETVRATPPVAHPVIRTHPDSGRRALFVNRLFTTHIVELGELESAAILDYLYKHLETPEYTCRWQWEPNAIAFWDNRATLHRPVNDYFPATRRMQRVTITGDRPR